ncbi:Hypothetical protein PBC10988_36880 [Planctomycetales bacterium 10988]|nr:Hypothetical protein PBC10988_36880 [Planctomycetales bacterium 10988]
MRTQLLLLLGLFLLLGSFSWNDVEAQRRFRPPARPLTEEELMAKKAQWQAIPAEITFPDPASFQTQGDSDQMASRTVDWSKWLPADVIQQEVGNLADGSQEAVKNEGFFSSRGFRTTLTNATTLAVLYHAAAKQNASVPWKEQALGLRDQAAEASLYSYNQDTEAFEMASKVFQHAMQIKEGAVPAEVPEGNSEAIMADDIADFSGVMRRMEIAQRMKLSRWTANEQEFNSQKDQIRHEAYLLAALAQVMLDKSYPLGEEEDYIGWTQTMRDNALRAAQAAENSDYETARTSIVDINLQCDSCHGTYR